MQTRVPELVLPTAHAVTDRVGFFKVLLLEFCPVLRHHIRELDQRSRPYGQGVRKSWLISLGCWEACNIPFLVLCMYFTLHDEPPQLTSHLCTA